MKLILTSALLAISMLMTVAPAIAQDESSPPPPRPAPPPCTQDQSPYRDFDFWIGAWQVVHPDQDQVLGRNTISREERGCLLIERWTSAGGGTGTSINLYDPLQEQWRQVWQSAGGFIDMSGGLDDRGRMVLEGTIHNNASGQQAPFRGRWTPNDDGSVLQEFWQKDDQGEWQSWFRGLYQPVDAGAGE